MGVCSPVCGDGGVGGGPSGACQEPVSGTRDAPLDARVRAQRSSRTENLSHPPPSPPSGLGRYAHRTAAGDFSGGSSTTAKARIMTHVGVCVCVCVCARARAAGERDRRVPAAPGRLHGGAPAGDPGAQALRHPRQPAARVNHRDRNNRNNHNDNDNNSSTPARKLFDTLGNLLRG